MSSHEWKVPVGADHVSAIYESGSQPRDTALFVCAHGAGGSMSDKGMLATAAALRSAGIGVVRFNFIYKEKGGRRPDFMPKLMDTVTAVVEHVRSELQSVPEARTGRSSSAAARWADARPRCSPPAASMPQGLLLLAYPLHPAGQPEKLRDAHLPQIRMPVLCFNGTRDPLCTPALMERALTTVTAPWQMEWVDGADHSFHVLKSSGRTDAEVMAVIAAVSEAWADRIPA